MLIAGVLATSLAGCGSNTSYGPSASCAHPSPVDKAPGIGAPELVGHGTGAQLWGLVQAPRYPLAAGDGVVKVVWHMTGRGALKLAEHTGSGQRIPLAWGPITHGAGASNYLRPGGEWGAGYRFARPGCYRLTARRSEGSGEVWLRVTPSNAAAMPPRSRAAAIAASPRGSATTAALPPRHEPNAQLPTPEAAATFPADSSTDSHSWWTEQRGPVTTVGSGWWSLRPRARVPAGRLWRRPAGSEGPAQAIERLQ